MCAINGFNSENESLIKKMNQLSAHRGPDDTGVYCGAGWSLGHNRLSIIDTSKAGHQPMLSRDKRYSITYNGELYNFKEIRKELEKKGHTFSTQTDTEVVLNAYIEWGKDSLKKFNGMFAFGILDSKTGELFLARDHIGVKPLYYYHKGNTFIFSSEVKALFAHRIAKELNTDALNIYFRMLYVPAPQTMWKDIFKLEPGHFAIVKNGSFVSSEYWGYGNEEVIEDKKEIQEKVKDLLTESIDMQTVSDRPLGVFLSGGIDSTIIAGVMSKLGQKLKTFSVGYEETEEGDKYNNDARVAKMTARHFGAEHHEFVLKHEDIQEAITDSIYHMDEPISNHVQAVNMLLAKETAKEVTVVLGGDGGDELFGGYERYYYSHIIDTFQKVPKLLRENRFAEWKSKMALQGNLYKKLNSTPGVQRYMEFFAQKEGVVGTFLDERVNNTDITKKTFEELYFQDIDTNNFTREFMRADVRSWLPNESLVRSDKMSMAAGLEQRVPFLDPRLVEYADRIPVKYKLGKKGLRGLSVGRHYEGKQILRDAMSEYLPDFVLEQPKWGWFSPASKWMRTPFGEHVREVLSPTYCKETQELFDFFAIERILDDHISKKKYALNTIWSLYTFQLWYRQFMKK